MARTLELEAAAAASQGQRPDQEDSSRIAVLEDGEAGSKLVLLVADGLGGHASGEVASRLACDAFLGHLRAGTADDLPGAMAAASAAIASAVRKNGELRGMGTTLVAAVVDAGGLRWLSVGDSSLLLLRDGALRRLNADHSLGAALDQQAEAGLIPEKSASSAPNRNALCSAIDGGDVALVDHPADPLRLLPGDVVLLASDGLDTLSPAAIAAIARAGQSSGATDLARRLVAETDAAGHAHQDNTTVVVLTVGGSAGQPAGKSGDHSGAGVTRRIGEPCSVAIAESGTGPSTSTPAPAGRERQRLPGWAPFAAAVVGVFLSALLLGTWWRSGTAPPVPAVAPPPEAVSPATGRGPTPAMPATRPKRKAADAVPERASGERPDTRDAATPTSPSPSSAPSLSPSQPPSPASPEKPPPVEPPAGARPSGKGAP